MSDYKVTFCLVYLGRFSPCSSVVYIKYTPSSHVENPLKLYDPDSNIYYYTSSNRAFLSEERPGSEVTVMSEMNIGKLGNLATTWRALQETFLD